MKWSWTGKELEDIRKRFVYVEEDPDYGKRLFFDNSGGSLRLREAEEARSRWDLLPDCPERYHERAQVMNAMMDACHDDLLHSVFGAKEGSLMTELTASQTFFQIMHVALENLPGKNVVTSNVEHPSAYDAAKLYCEKLGLELRVARANPKTGFVEPEEVARLVDEDTILVGVIAASNISGNIMDLRGIGEAIRKKNPEVYFFSDAVQHMPHGVVDVEGCGIDFMNFAPYKFFASRGIGIGYISPRLASLCHHKLEAKAVNEWELGSPAPGVFASVQAVIDYVVELGGEAPTRRESYLRGMEAIAAQERALLELLLEGTEEVKGLRHRPYVHVYVDGEDLTLRDLIVAMGIEGRRPEELTKAYARHGVTVYERVNSSLYSKRILEAMNLEGAVRVSPLHCHTPEEILRFLDITEEIWKEGEV